MQFGRNVHLKNDQSTNGDAIENRLQINEFKIKCCDYVQNESKTKTKPQIKNKCT